MSSKRAFYTVYKTTSAPLRRFISRRMGNDQQVVDDIFQETMLAAYKGWHTFEHKSKYLTWLCRISLNKMADYYRRNIHEGSRIVVPLIDDLDSLLVRQLTPEEEAVTAEIHLQIRMCLSLLPEDYRRILELRYFRHYSYKKMATILGGTERSVEGKLYRAKKALREVWSDQNQERAMVFIQNNEIRSPNYF